ncbi:MAG: PcfJ domain-containing protein [Paludibacteraceae bacterium]
MNEIQRIKQLQPQVATFYEDIEEEKYKFVNREYDAHHCIMVYATQQVEEYQVISGYDIEIDYEPDINAAAYETFDEETKKQYDEDEGLYETFFEEHDPDEFAYNFFYAEVMQVWLNTRTGKATFLAKTRYDKQWLFDTEHDWIVINSGRKAPRYQKVYDYCKDTSGSGFWRDYSVHPALQQRGYTGIDAWDYDYYIGYVDDFSTNGKFAYNNNLITEFQKLLLGTSELEQPLKAFGIEDVLRIQEITDEQTRQAYVTALKIAKRHHYTIEDQSLWDDMVIALHILGKDVHNPFYVCPDNLREAHQKYYAQWLKKRKKDEEQRKREIAEQQTQILQERMQRFFDLLFQEKDITIRPLITYDDYEQEGKTMHHCVATYFDRANSLILSARDEKDNRLATIEVDLPTLSIVQCRGLQNQTPDKYDTINSIIIEHMDDIKSRKLKPLRQAV